MSSHLPFAGYGDDIIQFDPEIDGVQIVHIQGGSADGNFAVWTLTPELSQNELLVNTIGKYSGTCVAGLQGPIGAMQVQADSSWGFGFLGPGNLHIFSGSERGTGDAVLFMSPDLEPTSTAKILRVECHSDDNFTVWAYGGPTDLLVNVIGNYSGTVVVPRDTQFLAITCSGQWSLSFRS